MADSERERDADGMGMPDRIRGFALADLQFLLQFSDCLLETADPRAAVARAMRLLAQHLGLTRCLLLRVPESGEAVRVEHQSQADGLQPLPDRQAAGALPQCVDRLRSGRWVSGDVQADAALSPPQRASLRALDLAACAIVVTPGPGPALRVLMAGASCPRNWTDAELRLLDEAAQRAWSALEGAEAQQALRESEARYRALFAGMDAGYCVIEVLLDAAGKGVDYIIHEANPAFAAHTGLADVLGKPIRALLPELEPFWFETYARIAATGVAEHFEHCAGPLARWFDVYAFPVGEPQQRRVAVLFRDINERKRSEHRLRENEQRFRALLTAGAYSMYRMSPDWQLMYQLDSDSLAETPEPISGWVDKYILAEDRPAVFAAIEQAIATGSLFEMEHRVWLADGSVGWVLSRAVPVRDANGDIREWFGVGHDVTQRRAVLQQLHASEERLRQFGEASHDVLWMRDARNMQWTYLTRAFETIYGLRREDALSGDNYRSWLELIVPEDRALAHAAFTRVLAGEHITFEYRVRRPGDGKIRWLRDTDFPITDANGEITMVGGIGEDVTEARRSQERLASSEERLRTAINVGKLGLWDWDAQTGKVYWSAEHYRLLGYQPGEVKPSRKVWAQRVHLHDRATAQRLVREASATHTEYNHEYRVVHPNGTVRWVQDRGRFAYDKHGKPIRMVGAMVDTTERREWEERQKVLVAELQHRTRNLMGVILAVTEKTIRSSADLADFQSRFTDRLNALARVQGLLSRLKDYDRVTFDQLLHAELSALEGSLEKVTLSGPDDVRLRSSSVQTLALAIHELATNAVKYGAFSQPGGRLEVTWTLQQKRAGAPWLVIDWRELGVDTSQLDQASMRMGQGRELIEKALPYQLGAKTSYSVHADGIHCRISLPVSATGRDNGR